MKVIKLGEISDIKGGYAFKSDKFTDEGVPIVRIGNLNNGTVELDYNICYPKEFLENNREYEIKKNDILIAMSGATIGKTAKYSFDIPALLNQRVGKIVVNEKVADNNFVYYFLKSKEFNKQIQNIAYGCAQPNISAKQILSIKIPKLPKEIQHKIAEVLDKAQSLIDKRKEQIKEYDRLKESLFYDMFGDPFTKQTRFEWCKLGDVVEINPSKEEINNIDFDVEVSFIPMECVSVDGELKTNQTKIIEDVYKRFTYFRENDVLFAKITPCMENGKGAIAKGLCNGIGFGSTEFHVLRPMESKSTSSWIFQLTKLSSFRKYAEMKMTGSAGQKRVPVSFLKEVYISVPTLELQNKFAEKVQKIGHQKQLLKQSLSLMEDNFNALMQKAFKGELFS